MVSGSEDGTLRVWDARSGAALARLAGHTAEVNAVAAFRVAGAVGAWRVASGAEDATVRRRAPTARSPGAAVEA